MIQWGDHPKAEPRKSWADMTDEEVGVDELRDEFKGLGLQSVEKNDECGGKGVIARWRRAHNLRRGSAGWASLAVVHSQFQCPCDCQGYHKVRLSEELGAKPARLAADVVGALYPTVGLSNF